MTTTNKKADESNTEMKVSKKDSVSAGLELIKTAVTGFKSAVQGILQSEPKVNEAALYAVRHAAQFGDVTLADRLVKGLRSAIIEVAGKGKTHPVAEAMLQELIAWFRGNSPIRWDAKGHCHQAKEGEPGYRPYDLEKAEEAGFFETERAVASRDAALRAAKRELEPYTVNVFMGRILGLRKTFQKAMEPDANGDIRGIKKGDGPKIRRLLEAVEAAAQEVLPGSVKDAEKDSTEESKPRRTRKAA